MASLVADRGRIPNWVQVIHTCPISLTTGQRFGGAPSCQEGWPRALAVRMQNKRKISDMRAESLL